MSDLRVLLQTEIFRGDGTHAGHAWIAHELKPEETVIELADRLLVNSAQVNLGGQNEGALIWIRRKKKK